MLKTAYFPLSLAKNLLSINSSTKTQPKSLQISQTLANLGKLETNLH